MVPKDVAHNLNTGNKAHPLPLTYHTRSTSANSTRDITRPSISGTIARIGQYPRHLRQRFRQPMIRRCDLQMRFADAICQRVATIHQTMTLRCPGRVFTGKQRFPDRYPECREFPLHSGHDSHVVRARSEPSARRSLPAPLRVGKVTPVRHHRQQTVVPARAVVAAVLLRQQSFA